jgi:cellulose synthase operon protein C
MRNICRKSLLAACLVWLAGCGHHSKSADTAIEEIRKAGANSVDSGTLERWVVDEMLAPGGNPEGVKKARSRLESIHDNSMRAQVIRGLDDALHGRFRDAPEHFLKAAQAARLSLEPQADLVGWFAIHSAIDLRKHDPNLYGRWQDWVRLAIEEPLHLGWRARGELVDWWSHEAMSLGEADVEERASRLFGCTNQLTLAGPFGHGAGRDITKHFAAESFGPWPRRWQPESGIGTAPRVLDTERHGCLIEPKSFVPAGVFYAETYLDLPNSRDLIVAVQGATMMWIDDSVVMKRDPRDWGVWPHFGTRVRLRGGRHRLVARLGTSNTSLRILDSEGRPARVEISTDGARGHLVTPPELGPDPNVVDAFVRQGNVVEPTDNLVRLLAADLLAIEGQYDVASVLLERLVADTKRATGPALLSAARYAQNDPLFEPTQMRDLMHALHEAAAVKDPELWEPQLALALWTAEAKGPKDAIATMEALATHQPQVPGVLGALAQLYRKLGWGPQHMHSLQRLEQRFPDDPSALEAALTLHDGRGEWEISRRLVDKIVRLDADREIRLSRALDREDYATALAELARLGKQRPDRRLIAERISDVMIRMGNTRALWDKLRSILHKNPKNPEARLSLADANLASGQRNALWHAIIEGVQSGAPTDDLRDALDLLDGLTELEPFRLDGLKIIRDFEQSGRELQGTAARILDYSALWIHADASARMLEHEVVRIQSAEAVREFSEYSPPNGIILHLRVVKKDGTTLEPEVVTGKSTVTMPHLELGDYVETEAIVTYEDDDQGGQSYLSPTWFFREEKLAYARSEYVVICPESRPLAIEQRGSLPEPIVEHRDGLVVRRWRVDDSPAAASEPFSPSNNETMPNIRLGWGATLDRQLRNLVDATTVLTPIDPRVVRIAKRIVAPLPPQRQLARAQRLYRWVLDNVEEGEETDGRRIIVGRRGNRWRGLIELCRALSIPIEYAVAHNRLKPPPAGPFDAALEYDEPVLRLEVDKQVVWLTVVDKYAPFGYLPAQVRGTQAYRLGTPQPKLENIPSGATRDGFDTDGTGELRSDGSAHLDLVQTFSGKLAIVLRNVLAQEPQAQLRSFVEGRLFGRALKGSRVVSFDFLQRDDLDQPLILKASVDVPAFAQVRGSEMVLPPPFTPNLSQLVALATRTTPLVFSESSEQHVSLRLKLPKGATIRPFAARTIRQGDREVVLADHSDADTLVLDRSVRMPAGRVSIEQYPAFARYIRDVSDALSSQITIRPGTTL